MKFKFDPNIDYQLEAINSVIGLFEGNRSDEGNIAYLKDYEAGRLFNYQAVSNKLMEVQVENNINQELDKLEGMNFTLEMETGTGKTYVYLRTILELNKVY